MAIPDTFHPLFELNGPFVHRMTAVGAVDIQFPEIYCSPNNREFGACSIYCWPDDAEVQIRGVRLNDGVEGLH
eukprot:m.225424 g.225424  ORF g.225424 m.225424 type:complete len:73 (+) comp40015_c0_seq20:248-466(+)